MEITSLRQLSLLLNFGQFCSKKVSLSLHSHFVLTRTGRSSGIVGVQEELKYDSK